MDMVSFRPGESGFEDAAMASVDEVPKTPDGGNDVRLDYFVTRDGARFAGTHLLIDLYEAEGLSDLKLMERSLQECIAEAGATLLHFHLHHFTPNDGISGVAVLAESHISVHTWPEAGYAAFDAFMCGDARPEVCVGILARAFRAGRVEVRENRRGESV